LIDISYHLVEKPFLSRLKTTKTVFKSAKVAKSSDFHKPQKQQIQPLDIQYIPNGVPKEPISQPKRAYIAF